MPQTQLLLRWRVLLGLGADLLPLPHLQGPQDEARSLRPLRRDHAVTRWLRASRRYSIPLRGCPVFCCVGGCAFHKNLHRYSLLLLLLLSRRRLCLALGRRARQRRCWRIDAGPLLKGFHGRRREHARPILVPAWSDLRLQGRLDVRTRRLALHSVWPAVVLEGGAIVFLQVAWVDTLDNSSFDNASILDFEAVGLASIDDVFEVFRAPIRTLYGVLDALLEELSPTILVHYSLIIVEGDDVSDGSLLNHIVRLVQLQDLSHVRHGEGPTLVEMIPQLGHVVLEGH
mmetsp:Transcript_75701/g.213254  ORF Transcript_75701/g.213254 Transcript_75701/m.213254 type:complete len:286 (+) Transcript_75701:639-1496(+)